MSTAEQRIPITCAECGRTSALLPGASARCPGCGQRLTATEAAPPRPSGRLIGRPSALAEEPPGEPFAVVAPRRTFAAPHRTFTPAESAVERPSGRVGARPAPPTGVARWAHWLLVLLMFPLAGSMITRSEDAGTRWERTLQRLSETQRASLEALPETASVDDLFALLPGRRIDGALLAHDSRAHWAFAALASLAFFGVCLVFPRGAAEPRSLLGVAAFTATFGIALLLLFQVVAEVTQHLWVKGAGVLTIIFYVVKFVGFSYRAALDPSNGFMASMVGFTCGVGLCEELCKALPLIFHFRARASLDWRGALLWGLASGIGFGVSEGVHYAGEFYNGSSTGGIYVVRFVSCVALHAVWSAGVALTIARDPSRVQSHDEWWSTALSVVQVLLVAMILHGLYDTLLKRDMSVLALATAVASVAWLVWLVERNLSEEADGAVV